MEAGDKEMTLAEKFGALIGDAYGGRVAAILNMVAEGWDDLVDGDKAVPSAQVNELFQAALLDLPANPFFQRHSEQIGTVIAHTVLNWRIANELEKGSPADLEAAHILRYMGASMVAHLALLHGGMEHAVAAGVQAWRMTTREPFAEYQKEKSA